MRYLGITRGDKESEAGTPPTPELMQAVGTFMEEVQRAGILIASDGLMPSSHAKRVSVRDGRATVTDGPFAETKEVIASYAIFETKSIDEAAEWTTRFLKVIGGGECDIYPIQDFSPEA
jgi:hypothetical protein